MVANTWFYKVFTSLGKGEVSGSSPDEGTRGIACYQRDNHYRKKKFIKSERPITSPLFCFKGKYLKVHHTNDDTQMATIKRSGSGWQVLIRRNNYVGTRSRTFLTLISGFALFDLMVDILLNHCSLTLCITSLLI